MHETYDFLPFGESNSCTGANTTPRCFTGHPRDPASALDYFGARYYASLAGRFQSADLPFVDQHPANPQSWNLYAYARNNPLRFIDPTGHFVQMVHGQATKYTLDGIELFGDMLGLLQNREGIELEAPKPDQASTLKVRVTKTSFWLFGVVQIGEVLTVELMFEDISAGPTDVSVALVQRTDSRPVKGAEALT